MYCPATGNIKALHLEDVRNLHNVMLDKHKCHDLTGNLSTIIREWSHDMLFKSVRIERPLYKQTRIYSTSFLCFLCSLNTHTVCSRADVDLQVGLIFDRCSYSSIHASVYTILKKTVSANIMHKAHICVSDVVLWLWRHALTRHFGATSRTPF